MSIKNTEALETDVRIQDLTRRAQALVKDAEKKKNSKIDDLRHGASFRGLFQYQTDPRVDNKTSKDLFQETDFQLFLQ